MSPINKLNRTIKYLAPFLEAHDIEFKKDHPWRRSGLHALQHGLRVMSLCFEIAEIENIQLSEEVTEVLQIAAVIHDIGCVVKRENHGKISLEITDKWLNELVSGEQRNQIIKIVSGHSSKDFRDDDLLSNLFKDADLLDEYGVQSLMMCGNWIDRTTPFYFRDLEARIEMKELSYGEQLIKRLYFKGSKEIIKTKIEFMKAIHHNLVGENKGSLTYEDYLKIKS